MTVSIIERNAEYVMIQMQIPLEVDGRIILTSTPRFAKQISHKYAEMSSPRLVEDLQENHGRSVPRSFVPTLAEAVGSIALLKEEDWHHQTPKLLGELAKVAKEQNMLLMMCDLYALERNLAEGEPRWCNPDGTGRQEPGNCIFKEVVEGVTIGCFPDLYTALSSNPPDQVITL